MSGKCGKCEEDFVGGEFNVKCVECNLLYHPACTRTRSVQKFTKTKLKSWKCDSCQGDSVSLHSNEDVEDKRTILDAIHKMKIDINTNIDSKIGSVQGSIESLTEEFRQLNSKVHAIEEEQGKLKGRCNQLERAHEELSGEVQELKLQLRDAEQHSRSANIEVQGLPLTPGEDLYDALKNIAAAINVPFTRRDVSIAHRLKLFSKKHAHPPVIVQFVSRSVREEWLSAARKKKGLNATEVSARLPPSAVYLNDHLTSHNKALLGRARRLLRERKLHFAGFFNGKVLIKRREGDDAVRVTSIEDLDKFDR